MTPTFARQRIGVVAKPAAALTVAVATWWATAALLDLPRVLLPTPPEVADAFTRHWPYLIEQAGITIGHTLAGFALAAAAGIAVAVMLAAIGWLREAVLPLLVAVQAIPKVAVAPLLVVWLGFDATPKITLVMLLCFFPIVVTALSGLTATPTDLIDLARSMSAPRWRLFWTIRIPHALPQLFAGLKVAGSLALIGAVVAQITTPNAGLGAVIVRSGQAADTPLAFAAITLLAAIGITIYYSLTAAERLLLPWNRATTA